MIPQARIEWVDLLDHGWPFAVYHLPTRSGALERRSLLPRTVAWMPLAYRTDRTGD